MVADTGGILGRGGARCGRAAGEVLGVMADIVEFDPSRTTIRLRRPSKPCRHERKITVCAQTRTVECDECGAVIDPYDFLESWAKDALRWESSVRSLRLECKFIGKRLAILKRLERNARARCSKLMKLPESWVLDQLKWFLGRGQN